MAWASGCFAVGCLPVGVVWWWVVALCWCFGGVGGVNFYLLGLCRFSVDTLNSSSYLFGSIFVLGFLMVYRIIFCFHHHNIYIPFLFGLFFPLLIWPALCMFLFQSS